MSELSHHRFEHEVRSNLFNAHGFNHEQLQGVSDAFKGSLEKIGHSSINERNFSRAVEHMEQHDVWGKLSHSQRNTVISTLKSHVGIKDAPTPQ